MYWCGHQTSRWSPFSNFMITCDHFYDTCLRPLRHFNLCCSTINIDGGWWGQFNLMVQIKLCSNCPPRHHTPWKGAMEQTAHWFAWEVNKCRFRTHLVNMGVFLLPTYWVFWKRRRRVCFWNIEFLNILSSNISNFWIFYDITKHQKIKYQSTFEQK